MNLFVLVLDKEYIPPPVKLEQPGLLHYGTFILLLIFSLLHSEAFMGALQIVFVYIGYMAPECLADHPKLDFPSLMR